MPNYSAASQNKLLTCEPDLQVLFNYVIKYFDNTILYGHRSPEEQFELYKKGRILQNGIWVITNKSKVVTYKDGYKSKSKHNYLPSKAVDAVAYPIDFKNVKRQIYFAGFVKGIAQMLLKYGAIEHKIICGIDWDDDTMLNDQKFADIYHFQIA